MKISGPKGPGPTAPLPEQAETRADKPGAATFHELLETKPSAGSPPLTGVAGVAERLKAGEISSAQATELVIDAAVRARAPRASQQVQETMKAELRRLLAEDPVLAAKVRRLTEASRSSEEGS